MQMTKYRDLALQIIHATGGDPKRADEAANVIEATVSFSPPAQPDLVTSIQLQARPADGGDWVNIFPAQLQGLAKHCDVRALECSQSAHSGETK
jgi:hypothetical protein